MACKVCNKVSNHAEYESCFEYALDILKKHYVYNKNALKQRDFELKQVKERNEQLNKALQLIQKAQQPAKRMKSQLSDDSWLGSNSPQEDRVINDHSLTDSEAIAGTNLNIALNSEQLFDTSALSQTKSDISITSFSQMPQSPRVKGSHKRKKHRDALAFLEDRNKKGVERSKSECYNKEGNSPLEKSWAMKFLQPAKALEEKVSGEGKKPTDKKLSLTLKRTNPSKVKQSLIPFNKLKDNSFRESEVGDDIIEASPVIESKNTKVARSWSHRSGHVCNSNITKETTKKDDPDEIIDDIVFDFSPSKKTDSILNMSCHDNMKPQELKFDSEISKDCISLPNNNSRISTNKPDSSSVVILTPGTQDIIFVEDTCNSDPEIDTIDLLADIMKSGSIDNLENLKKYEINCIQNQQKNKEIDLFKKPSRKPQTDGNVNNLAKIKKEKITQENLQDLRNIKEIAEKPRYSKSFKTAKPQNPLFSSEDQDAEDDEDCMPKPFIIKEETEYITKKLSIKQRFNIDCEDCEKLINFLDKRLTDDQIQQHLDKCKRHNNPDFMRQNTPTDFWNPFILSFQADDPRNEILIDNRFKDPNK